MTIAAQLGSEEASKQCPSLEESRAHLYLPPSTRRTRARRRRPARSARIPPIAVPRKTVLQPRQLSRARQRARRPKESRRYPGRGRMNVPAWIRCTPPRSIECLSRVHSKVFVHSKVSYADWVGMLLLGVEGLGGGARMTEVQTGSSIEWRSCMALHTQTSASCTVCPHPANCSAP